MSNERLDKIIVALDNMTRAEVSAFLDRSEGRIGCLKIGMEMFYAHGPDYVRDIWQQYQTPIFLDLKLHDIPNTVSKAIKSLGGLPVKYLTIHLSGGIEMLRAAKEAAAEYMPGTGLLGVSYLTSLGPEDLNQMWQIKDSDKAFTTLFSMAADAGIHGLILSAGELALAKEVESARKVKFEKITPGIRFQQDLASGNDQKRVFTPDRALSEGADCLVIGRGLTQAKNLKERLDWLRSLN